MFLRYVKCHVPTDDIDTYGFYLLRKWNNVFLIMHTSIHNKFMNSYISIEWLIF